MQIFYTRETILVNSSFLKSLCRVFSVISPPADYFPPPPVEAVAAATSVFTEYVFCESVDCAHKTQISSTLQEADCLLKLVKVNKQVFAITLY